jgi:hypothetical protein
MRKMFNAATSILIVVVSASTTAASFHQSRVDVPKGMIANDLQGPSHPLHRAVVDGTTSDDLACQARLAHLRTLVSEGKLHEAVDFSLALEPHHRADKIHGDCHVDKPHVGEGSIVTKIASPDRHSDPSMKPIISSFIKLHGDKADEFENVMPIVHASGAEKRVKSVARAPVVGFALDGKFILSDSQLRCTSIPASKDGMLSCSGGADLRNRVVKDSSSALALAAELTGARKRVHKESDARRLMTEMGKPLVSNPQVVAQELARESVAGSAPSRTMANLGDADTSYAIGVKTVLVIPLVPLEGVTDDNQLNHVAPEGYDYGLVKSVHSSNIRSYLTACMQANSDYYKDNSWGAMEFATTITPVLKVWQFRRAPNSFLSNFML